MYYMSQNTFDEKLFLVEFEGGAGLQLCESFLLFLFYKKKQKFDKKTWGVFQHECVGYTKACSFTDDTLLYPGPV